MADNTPKTAPRITLYTSLYCPYCVAAKTWLHKNGLTDIEEIRVDLHPDKRIEMMERSGRRTVPQIWFDATHIGGYDDLIAQARAGTLPL